MYSLVNSEPIASPPRGVPVSIGRSVVGRGSVDHLFVLGRSFFSYNVFDTDDTATKFGSFRYLFGEGLEVFRDVLLFAGCGCAIGSEKDGEGDVDELHVWM